MINAIVAVEKSQGIGFEGQMPWPHLKGDMAWFKKLTAYQIVIMGSTTWLGLSKPLPDRINVVLSSNFYSKADHSFSNIGNALDFCNLEYPDKEIFIIGGQSIYDQTMRLVSRFYVTEIDADYKCDKKFNLEYVKSHSPIVKEHVQYTDPITYTMKEYNI